MARPRERMPRKDLGRFEPAADRLDPVAILETQAESRVPELVPIRYGRMSSSAFAFFRGGAAIMAADLAATANSGLTVQLCGDAHLANFGGFASPERDLVFDINDFDETHPGPFEWDLKRLAASIEIAGRNRGFDPKVNRQAVLRMTHSYRMAMRRFATMHNLEVWYERLDVNDLMRAWGPEAGAAALKNMQRMATKARAKDRMRAAAKLTTRNADGELRFRSDPPVVVPVEEIEDFDAEWFEGVVKDVIRSYRRTLATDRRRLLDTYRYVHTARKVVGVGSVGTRAWVVLMVGSNDADPLFLQMKQAESSVLEPHLGRSQFRNHGQRVVEGQRLMQATSDIFLGWHRVTGVDGIDRDFYVRQLWDWKTSANLDLMRPEILGVYGEICGWTLARAHARSGDRVAIAAYLGARDVFDRAMVRFARAYADQNELDHRALTDAIGSGAVMAQTGI